VLLVVGIAWIVVLAPGALPAGELTVVGMIIVLVGAYRAYRRVAPERDDPQTPPEPEAVRFTIKTGRPYAGIPSGLNSLIIPDVGVVNWSDTAIELSFTLLAADGSGTLESVITSSRTVSTGLALRNPMQLDPHSSDNGRLIWVHGGGDPTQYLAAGAALRVVEEQTGVLLDIPLSTDGFDYPAQKRS
jgi:hypothetical protein